MARQTRSRWRGAAARRTTFDDATIVANCRSRRRVFLDVLLGFAQFRRRPLVLGELRAEKTVLNLGVR